MAALMSSRTSRVIGPIAVGDAKLYVDGFVAGAQSIDSSISATGCTGSFSDASLMRAAPRPSCPGRRRADRKP